jgi:hypothetical protein
MVKRKKTTVGVVFPHVFKIYTYVVPVRHGIKVGDYLSVDTPWGPGKVVRVVRIDSKPVVPEGYTMRTLKKVRARFVERKIKW